MTSIEHEVREGTVADGLVAGISATDMDSRRDAYIPAWQITVILKKA